jgi:hypothetical protein
LEKEEIKKQKNFGIAAWCFIYISFMQPGDVYQTYADVDDLMKDIEKAFI